MESILTNPFILMFGTIFIGKFLGLIDIKGVSLGSSGGLFVGIFISYGVTAFLLMGNPDFDTTQNFISGELFNLSLVLFIASVGLAASKNIRRIIRNNGPQFIILAFVVTLTGSLATWAFVKLFQSQSLESVVGTFSGALTSSPGLAAAIESSLATGGSEALVGLGYSIAYVPGVIIVILFVQILAKSFREKGMLLETDSGDTEEMKIYRRDKETEKETEKEKEKKLLHRFSVTGFSLVCASGVLLGNVSIPLGETLGEFSLGATGGVLIMALFLGDRKKIGKISFEMDEKVLGVTRDLALKMFLAIVGLNYGYEALTLIRTTGVELLFIGFLTGLASIGSGYLVGSKLLKIKPLYLIGGLCGGMTSTPGLAAAIESTDSNEVGVAYGATYPFALFFMILFINLLFQIA